MSEFHSQLLTKHPHAVARSCSKEGCELNLSGLSPKSLILDCDLYRTAVGLQGKICDFFVFPVASQVVVAIVELKSGSVDSSHAVLQLRAASAELSTMIGKITVREFYPLIIAGRIAHASQLKVLRAAKITFRGKDHPVIFGRCGTRLHDVLRRYGSGCVPSRTCLKH